MTNTTERTSYIVTKSDLELPQFQEGGYTVGDKIALKKIKLTAPDLKKNNALAAKGVEAGQMVEVIDFGSEELIDAREKLNGLSTLVKLATGEHQNPEEIKEALADDDEATAEQEKLEAEKKEADEKAAQDEKKEELKKAKAAKTKPLKTEGVKPAETDTPTEQKIDVSKEGLERTEIKTKNAAAILDEKILQAYEDSKRTDVTFETHGLIFTSRAATLGYKGYKFRMDKGESPVHIENQEDFEYLLGRGDFRLAELPKNA